MLEIRPATADEMPRLRHIVGRSLAMPTERLGDLQPEFTLCAFVDDALATVHGSWPLTMRFNGKAVPISGVTTVSTDAVHRQSGYLRKVITQHFQELHDGGERPLAVLYASQAAIYQRYGYAVTSTHVRYEIEPRFIQFAEPLAIPGRLREVDAERDFAMLVDIYRRFREDKTGYVHRGRPMWTANALSPAEGHDLKTVLVYEEGDVALGYVILTTGDGGFNDGPDVGQKVVINDMAWLTPAAYRAIWTHLSRHPLARYITQHAAPGDDPLPHLLLEPRMLRATAHDGLLARVVDLPGAFRARGYQVSETLRFEVIDDLCPWNAGRWQVNTGADDADVARLDGGEIDLTLSVATLAMLLFGQVSATQAARAGRIEVHDPGALPRWDAALRTLWAPFCADNF